MRECPTHQLKDIVNILVRVHIAGQYRPKYLLHTREGGREGGREGAYMIYIPIEEYISCTEL